MKIKANREPLADALTRAQRAVGTRGSLPVLQGILCEASDGKLWATGTDLEVTVRSQLDVEVLEPGKAILPGRLLTQAVRRMPSGMVTFETVDGSQVKISGETEMPVYMLRQLGEDFPPMSTDTGEGVQVDGEGLAEAIKQVAPSASTDLGRAVSHGSAVRVKRKKVAPGGHRFVPLGASRPARHRVVGDRDAPRAGPARVAQHRGGQQGRCCIH